MKTKTKHNFKRGTLLPEKYDPWRRFAAAYTLQALLDYFYPIALLTPSERDSAVQFVHSTEGRQLINALGIPYRILPAAFPPFGAKLEGGQGGPN